MKQHLEKLLGIQSAVLILTLTVVRYLFRFSSVLIVDILQGVLFLLAVSVLIATMGVTRSKRDVKKRPWQFAMSLVFLAALAITLVTGEIEGNPHSWTVVWATNIYLGFMAFITLFGHLIKLTKNVSPSLILPASFMLVIIAGAALLMAPRCTTGGISVLDAVFTSTSATCVTGLIVLDTETDFTFMGQLVILVLIQVGGLGLMTFAAFFAISLGQSLGISDTVNLARLMDSEFSAEIKHIILSILVWTLAIESAGALLLYNTWSGMENWSTTHTVWQAVFHSVSAFCNAGFSLNSTNLLEFRHSPATSAIIGSLIVLGGLGFMLLTVLGRNWLTRMKTGRKHSLPVQIRFVLLITAILIITGWLVFTVLEWDNTLSGMTLVQKLGNGYLEAVSPRTAGFNTVPTDKLLPPVKWFFIILMFIGASPGGTGGGVKTTTIGLLYLSVRSLLQKRMRPEIWRRRIPIFDLQRAGAVLLVGMAAFGLSSMLLLVTEGTDGDFTSMDYIFEAMSAFGTVGLSTGVTEKLSTAGKWIIIVTMFIGRTAPATLAAATVRVRTSGYSYPEARITIG